MLHLKKSVKCYVIDISEGRYIFVHCFPCEHLYFAFSLQQRFICRNNTINNPFISFLSLSARCRHTAAAVHTLTHVIYLHALHSTQHTHTVCTFCSSFFGLWYQLNYQKCICSNFTVFLFESDRIILCFVFASLFSTVSHVNVLILKHFLKVFFVTLEKWNSILSDILC